MRALRPFISKAIQCAGVRTAPLTVSTSPNAPAATSSSTCARVRASQMAGNATLQVSGFCEIGGRVNFSERGEFQFEFRREFGSRSGAKLVPRARFRSSAPPGTNVP